MKKAIIFLGLMLILITLSYAGTVERRRFTVRAYCGCRKCINDQKVRDGKFASGKKVYFGGIAASRWFKFGDKIALEKPILGRTVFTVEDRGPNAKYNRIEIFVTDELGGHQTALQIGKQFIYGKVVK